MSDPDDLDEFLDLVGTDVEDSPEPRNEREYTFYCTEDEPWDPRLHGIFAIIDHPDMFFDDDSGFWCCPHCNAWWPKNECYDDES